MRQINFIQDQSNNYFRLTFIDLELSGLTTSPQNFIPITKLHKFVMHSTGFPMPNFQFRVAPLLLVHLPNSSITTGTKLDFHTACTCKKEGCRRRREKKRRRKKKKMHIAISGGKPTVPIFQYSDFRVCRTFLFIFHRDWDSF